MLNFVFYLIVVALFSAFIILFLSKTGLRDFIILHSPIKLISELFDCDFCLSFWTSLALSVIFTILLNNVFLMLLPFLCAPLIRKLL